MTVLATTEPLFKNGIKQYNMYELYYALGTNLSLLATTLNADTGVTAIDYAGVLLSTYNATASANGVNQYDYLVFLSAWITAFNVILPKLDTDGLTDSDYNSTLAITNTIAANCAGDGSTYLGYNGVNQGTLMSLLNTCVTNLNALNAKLDADGTVNTATYAATCNITDTLDSVN